MTRTGDILGYARVSTADQDLSGQKDRLLRHGAVRVSGDVLPAWPGGPARPGQALRHPRRHPTRSPGPLAQGTP